MPTRFLLLFGACLTAGCASVIKDDFGQPITRDAIAGTWIACEWGDVFYYLDLRKDGSGILCSSFGEAIGIYRIRWDIKGKYKLETEIVESATSYGDRPQLSIMGTSRGIDLTLEICGQHFRRLVRFIREARFIGEISRLKRAIEIYLQSDSAVRSPTFQNAPPTALVAHPCDAASNARLPTAPKPSINTTTPDR